MNRLRLVAGRLVGLVVSVWAVVSLLFVYFEVTPYTGSGTVGPEGVTIPVSADDPLTQRYVDWLAWLVGVPGGVVDPIASAAGYTAAYLVPAMALAVVVGTTVRVYSVARNGTLLDRSLDAVALLGISVPAFVVAVLFREFLLVEYLTLLGRIGLYDTTTGPLSGDNLTAAVYPGVPMFVYLTAVQFHRAGEGLRAYADEEFVKTARAKGVGDWRVGWHIFRNTAVTIVFVHLTELYGLLLVGVFTVEYVTEAPGLGELTIRAVLGGNLPLILGITLLVVLLGVLSTFVQDIMLDVFDPRVTAED